MSNSTNTQTIIIDLIGGKGKSQQTAILDPTFEGMMIIADSTAELLGFPVLEAKDYTVSDGKVVSIKIRIGFINFRGNERAVFVSTFPYEIPTFAGRKFQKLFDL